MARFQVESPLCSDVFDRLTRLAGYADIDDTVAKGGMYAPEFQSLLKALNYIGNRKVDDYGDFRLQDIRSWDRETWGAFWDIMRKFGRLENQLAHHASVDAMIETLSDQAVYCVRMIQILLRLEERGMVPNERASHRNE